MIGATNLAEKLKESLILRLVFWFSYYAQPKVLSYDFVDFVFINEGVYALRI